MARLSGVFFVVLPRKIMLEDSAGKKTGQRSLSRRQKGR